VDRCLSFCPFLLTIVLSVFRRFTASDYPLISKNCSNSRLLDQAHDRTQELSISCTTMGVSILLGYGGNVISCVSVVIFSTCNF
jgi:hypothetical protein